ncbi:beta-lactamase/transpeptidase-like protein [Viridothelium virens]|uniref:Beta-lactamase/transpeptidase-like protein n=1 Tax=Viridothelium virens TaxID=1048519 RepID=A0A6A6HGH2_VIRVR|nr:beta-lactamase/transpeptidase-like protein [Viridothelium virens]
MRVNLYALATVVFVGASIAADTSTKICPVLGPAFPAPVGLSSEKLFQAAVGSFEDALEKALETDLSTNGPGQFNTTTMSIGMFSTSEDGLLYQRHYTDPAVRNSSFGTQQVDSRSIYRLGSIGKLLTVYSFLISVGDQRFNDPIAKYIPELVRDSKTVKSQNGMTPDWNETTLGQLASHMSGLSHDYLLHGLITEPALFRSGCSPMYSNNGFELLGLALERITGSKVGDLFTEGIVRPLALHDTSYAVPKSTQNGVIPGNTTVSGWANDAGILGPAGAPAQTRRWMKPVTFTAGINMAVGAPWEIYRAQVGGRTVDLYTKDGGWGAYATLLVLVPDFKFGFSILTANLIGSNVGAKNVYFIAEMLGSSILPALENVARQQANATFAGHYTSIASGLNSSLTVLVDIQPALRVENWVSNGTKIFEEVIGLDSTSGDYIDFRIQPNNLYSGNEVGFTRAWQIYRPLRHQLFDMGRDGSDNLREHWS